MHRAPFPRSYAIDLPPFALQWVLPISNYYDGSVTLGLAPRRPSRVPVVLHVLARRRCPIHPLQCARCTSPIMRRVRTAKVYRHAHDGAAARRGRDECEVPPLEIGVRAMPLSPYRTGLAGRHGTRLGFVANFAQKVIPGQLPLSVRRLRGERVELFGRSEALFPRLNHHLFFSDHVHEFDPN